MPFLKTQGFEIFDQFDRHDPKNIGRPMYWDTKIFIATIDMFMAADEIETAQWLLDHMPSWYRENPLPEIEQIRKDIYKQLYSPMDYANDPDEAGWTKKDAEDQWLTGYTSPRAEVLMAELVKLNSSGQMPWIFELSTSHGALPLGLVKHGIKFNFCAQNLNSKALDKVKAWLPSGVWKDRPDNNQYKIFINTESLEHMYREDDLRQCYNKIDVNFDMILLSTPLGCFFGGLPTWRDRPLGHVRGYTRRDFMLLADKYFQGFEWAHFAHHSQVLLGKRGDQSQ